jgi:hypothetical protein
MAATPDQIDQQRRVITQTRSEVAQLLALAASIRARLASYQRLGLDKADPAAFDGTGTNADAYAGAITALGQLAAMPEEVFIALEVFAT